jgi:hypothetical protein
MLQYLRKMTSMQPLRLDWSTSDSARCGPFPITVPLAVDRMTVPSMILYDTSCEGIISLCFVSYKANMHRICHRSDCHRHVKVYDRVLLFQHLKPVLKRYHPASAATIRGMAVLRHVQHARITVASSFIPTLRTWAQLDDNCLA